MNNPICGYLHVTTVYYHKYLYLCNLSLDVLTLNYLSDLHQSTIKTVPSKEMHGLHIRNSYVGQNLSMACINRHVKYLHIAIPVRLTYINIFTCVIQVWFSYVRQPIGIFHSLQTMFKHTMIYKA